MIRKGLCIAFIGILSATSCSKVETESQHQTEHSELPTDSMPVVEPEIPETANVIEPTVTDSMPVANPENIDKQ